MPSAGKPPMRASGRPRAVTISFARAASDTRASIASKWLRTKAAFLSPSGTSIAVPRPPRCFADGILRAATKVFAKSGSVGGRVKQISKAAGSYDRTIYLGSKELLYVAVLDAQPVAALRAVIR